MVSRIERRLVALGAIFLALPILLDGKPKKDGFWQEDFQAAKAQALEEEKSLLLVFTGSDWCLWCQKLESEIFHRNAFESHAASIAIPVRIDFPQRHRLPPRQQRRNDLLKSEWKVEALPTVILYDPVGNQELWRHGYLQSTPEEYAKGMKEAIAHARQKPPSPQ